MSFGNSLVKIENFIVATESTVRKGKVQSNLISLRQLTLRPKMHLSKSLVEYIFKPIFASVFFISTVEHQILMPFSLPHYGKTINMSQKAKDTRFPILS